MKSRPQENVPTRTLSTRVPATLADRVEAAAAAAQLSTSEFISRKLESRQTAMHPVLAILSQVIVIRAQVGSLPDPNLNWLEDLRELISELCILVRAELDR